MNPKEKKKAVKYPICEISFFNLLNLPIFFSKVLTIVQSIFALSYSSCCCFSLSQRHLFCERTLMFCCSLFLLISCSVSAPPKFEVSLTVFEPFKRSRNGMLIIVRFV